LGKSNGNVSGLERCKVSKVKPIPGSNQHIITLNVHITQTLTILIEIKRKGKNLYTKLELVGIRRMAISDYTNVKTNL